MQFEPKSYQQPAIDFLTTTPRCAMHAGIGSGKTVIALSAIDDLWKSLVVNRVLIVAPLNVVLNTIPDELEKWDHTRDISMSLLHGKEKEDNLTDHSIIHVINYEGLKWFLESPNRPFYDMIIFDECHWIKDHKTKRFGMLSQFLTHVPRIVMMSGTPIGNSLLDLWAQYYLLDGGERLLRSYEHYRGTYFSQDDYSGFSFVPYDWSEVAVIERVQDITFQVHPDDIELTECTESEIRCSMSPEAMTDYRQFEREYFLQVEEAEIEAFNAVALCTKLRQYANGFLYYGDTNVHRRSVIRIHEEKFRTLKELTDVSIENIMIVATFTEDFEALKKTYPGLPCVYGRTSKPVSRRVFKQWNEGKLPLMAIHPRSVGTGLNLQDGGCRQIWLSPDWSYLAKNQTIGRVHRTGQTRDVSVEVIVARNTIDEMILSALVSKTRTTESFARKLRLYRKLRLEG